MTETPADFPDAHAASVPPPAEAVLPDAVLPDAVLGRLSAPLPLLAAPAPDPLVPDPPVPDTQVPVPRTVAAPTPRVGPAQMVMTGVDGSHRGIALSLWLAQLDADDALSEMVADTFDHTEMLRSAVELLVALAGNLADLRASVTASQVLSEQAARNDGDVHERRLCRELARGLDYDGGSGCLVLTDIDVAVVLAACTALGEQIAGRNGQTLDEQIERHIVTVTDQAGDEL